MSLDYPNEKYIKLNQEALKLRFSNEREKVSVLYIQEEKHSTLKDIGFDRNYELIKLCEFVQSNHHDI